MRLGLIVVCLVACGGSQKSASTMPGALVVIEPGAEPRQVIRQQPPLHVREALDTTIKLRTSGAYTSTTLDTEHSMVDYPSIQAHEQLEATGTTATGATIVSAVIDSARVLDDVIDPRIKPMVAKRVAHLKGVKMSWRLEPSGAASAVESELNELPPGLLQSMVIAPSFPATAVGVGASWQAREDVTVGGIHWHQIRKYTLVAFDESSATLALDFSAHADSQPLSVEPDVTIRLTSGRMTLTGTAKIPLHGLAWSGEGRGTFETNLQIVKKHLRTSSMVTLEVLATSQPAHR